ncbi:hypothetical protein GCM10009414_08960 [Tatumella terrea]|uniref:hypothetical protein n=1 Tax=Tatumella terrea TaxID=419007 RepID=UPI0031D97B95
MRSEEITLLLPREDRELSKALLDAEIKYETPARDRMTFDSGDVVYTYISLLVYSMPLARVLIAYINKNKHKRIVIRRKNGDKIDIIGYSAKDAERLIKKGDVISVEDKKS